MEPTVPHSALTTVRRQRQKAAYDRSTVYATIDATPWCHLAVLVDGVAMAIPTLAVRDGDAVLLHGAKRSQAMVAAAAAERVAATFTTIDGLLVATTGFEHSVAYRTAIVVGPVTVLSGTAKRAALDRLLDGVLPGRSGELQPPTVREVGATTVLRLDLAEASAKVSAGPPDATHAASGAPVWAGTVPLETRWGTPVPVDPSIPTPASVRRLTGATS
jgi:nitroimidazol reductase NimA-like FMN-containing flavoprotein (pyridoxamine 5'-phosphate oxidase superfamily)